MNNETEDYCPKCHIRVAPGEKVVYKTISFHQLCLRNLQSQARTQAILEVFHWSGDPPSRTAIVIEPPPEM
jgi:hypothetical protein